MEKRNLPGKPLSFPERTHLAEKKGSLYFPHEADIGVEVSGKTPEEAFVRMAEATFALETDLSTVRPLQSVDISFREADMELALPTWINLLLSESAIRGFILCRFELERQDGEWKGRALGEPWLARHPRGIEVKGATLTGLSVRRENGLWKARLVVDV